MPPRPNSPTIRYGEDPSQSLGVGVPGATSGDWAAVWRLGWFVGSIVDLYDLSVSSRFDQLTNLKIRLDRGAGLLKCLKTGRK
jgi:hypothetical protein